MKKKLIACVLAVVTTGAVLPSVAHANGDTTTTEATPEVPEACIMPFLPLGPARAAHSPAGGGSIEEFVECEDIEGICVEITLPAPGPARAAHRPQNPLEPCTPIDASCDIVVEVNPEGPARAAHRPAGDDEEPVIIKGFIVEIPEECQEALSLAAIPDAGSDSATIMWLGAALVFVGGALMLTRRTVLARTH